MDVTKFVIDGNDVFVKDAQARDSITTLSDAVTTAQDTADRAEGKADDAQTGLESKQDKLTAWKIGQTSVTETVTINSLDNHLFVTPIPDGATNVIVLNARSSDTSRTLIPINLYTSSDNMCALMSNQRTSAYTDVSMTIQFTYAYQ